MLAPGVPRGFVNTSRVVLRSWRPKGRESADLCVITRHGKPQLSGGVCVNPTEG
jgi:hypothetical protein